MDKATAMIDEVTENVSLNVEDMMKKNDSITQKVKFKAFGQSKAMTKKAISRRLEDRLRAAQGLDDEDKLKELRRKHYEDMEEEINRLKLAKYGRATSVNKMKEVVAGPKKSTQEPHAILDKETNELVVGNEQIRKVILKHCLDSLENSEPDKDVKQLVKLVNAVHDTRMEEHDNVNEDVDVSKEEFEEVVNRIEKKKKKSYDFLTRAGDAFKDSMFQLCRRLIKEEQSPKRFFDTRLHQLWKGK